MKNYKGFSFFGFSDNFKQTNKLVKLVVNSDNWYIFYQNDEANWIEFYPFSEAHGGGAPYIINIGSNNFESWLEENKNFVNQVRDLIISKV